MKLNRPLLSSPPHLVRPSFQVCPPLGSSPERGGHVGDIPGQVRVCPCSPRTAGRHDALFPNTEGTVMSSVPVSARKRLRPAGQLNGAILDLGHRVRTFSTSPPDSTIRVHRCAAPSTTSLQRASPPAKNLTQWQGSKPRYHCPVRGNDASGHCACTPTEPGGRSAPSLVDVPR